MPQGRCRVLFHEACNTLRFVHKSAGLSDRVLPEDEAASGDGAVRQWFAGSAPGRQRKIDSAA